MPLPNQGMTFTPFDPLPASDLNDLVENIESLEDGSGFDLGNNVIPANALATSAVLLGIASITSNFNSSSTSDVQVTGLTKTVTIPNGGRSVLILATAPSFNNNTVNTSNSMGIWKGVVGSGTRLGHGSSLRGTGDSGSSQSGGLTVFGFDPAPSAGSITYNASFSVSGGSGTLSASSGAPAQLLVILL